MPKGYLDGSILSTWGMIITTVACFLLFLLLLGLAYIFLKPKREQIKENKFSMKDDVFQIYDAQMVHKKYPGRYDVKMRPYLAEFMINLMPKF